MVAAFSPQCALELLARPKSLLELKDALRSMGFSLRITQGQLDRLANTSRLVREYTWMLADLSAKKKR